MCLLWGFSSIHPEVPRVTEDLARLQSLSKINLPSYKYIYVSIYTVYYICVCIKTHFSVCSVSISCILLRSTSVLAVYLYIPSVAYHPAFPILPLCSCCSFQHSSLDIRVLFFKARGGGWDLVF